MGFGVRKNYYNKSKKDGSITSCRFVYCKEGIRAKNKSDYLTINPRHETRTDCKARVVLGRSNGKLIVIEFVEEHNHILHLAETTHIASQQRMSDVQAHELELANDSGIQQRAIIARMGKHVEGRPNLAYMHLDKEKYLPIRQQKKFERSAFFGVALLYDKTETSFKWLFETFLKTHNQKKPQTIITNQDEAIAKALQEVLPNTWHGLCTENLMQNGIKHLGNLRKNGSHFLRDFKACMYDYEEETEFEAAWSRLLSHYNIHENLGCTEARNGIIHDAKGKRMKSWDELQHPKRKVSRSISQPTVSHSQSEQFMGQSEGLVSLEEPEFDADKL
ncbi:protein FAR1-RELATED SEQUENCE 5-like [Senna tora]|uniref:Protein FAR1-RELATED SEQUENCE 5-like n=1 Tax=Senna tora TaxID=362788 RepID=A0A834WF36_9FABA|nr:protein FAR1-RELATED SEQUENCE 5-like [Senna tora]